MKNENGRGNNGEVQSANVNQTAVREQWPEGGGLKPEAGWRKAEGGSPGATELDFPVPVGEQDFLATLMQFMRSAKRSQDREVVRAARRWETAIGFRIRMALQERGRAASRSGGRLTANRANCNLVKGGAGL